MIQIKRIYDDSSEDDGDRVLIDRLWPRGVAKDDEKLDEWCGAVARSDELREWFRKDVDGRWQQFGDKYSEELRAVDDELECLARMV